MEINRTVYKDVSKGLKVKFELEALKKTEQPVQIAEVHQATAELLSNCFLYSLSSAQTRLGRNRTLRREKKVTN